MLTQDQFSLDFGSHDQQGALPAHELKAAILAAHAERENDPNKPFSISISHAKVSGRLELDGLFSDHQHALIGLVFVDCLFRDPILLNGSCLTMLTMKNCTLSSLLAVRACILGSVTLNEITSSEPQGQETGIEAIEDWHNSRGPEFLRERKSAIWPGALRQGRCSINFRGAKIGGNLNINESILVATPESPGVDKQDKRGNYALNISGAQIRGSVAIRNHSALLGGLSASEATIEGNLHASGALIRANERPAVAAQRLEIKGYLGLRNHCPPNAREERTELHGTVDLSGAKISSGIDMRGALFSCENSKNYAIILSTAETDFLISGSSKTDGTGKYRSEVLGRITFSNLEVAHDVWFDFRLRQQVVVNIESDTNKVITPVALDLYAAKIGGNLIFVGDWDATASCSEATVNGNLILGNGSDNKLRLRCPSSNSEALGLSGIQVAGSIIPSNLSVETQANLRALRDALRAKKVEIKTRISPLPFTTDARLVEFSVPIGGRAHYGMALEISGKLHYMSGHGPHFFGPLKRHGINSKSDSDRLAYFQTFCAVTNAEAGPFRVVEPGDWFSSRMTSEQRALVKPIEVLESENPNILRVRATIWYANGLFSTLMETNFKTLVVEMKEDALLLNTLPMLTTVTRPLVFSTGEVTGFDEIWHLPSPAPMAAPDEGLLNKRERRKLLRALPSPKSYDEERPVINLSRAHVGRLDDLDGNLWPSSVRLDLRGFTYDALAITTTAPRILTKRAKKRKNRENYLRQKALLGPLKHGLIKYSIYAVFLCLFYFVISNSSAPSDGPLWTPKFITAVVGYVLVILLFLIHRERSLNIKYKGSVYARRKRWLRLQYVGTHPTRAEFNPQPFEQLARVLRHQGQEETFRRISRLKSRWRNATVTFPIWRPFIGLYGLCFGYGFSIRRGIVTFLFTVTLGWLATEEALHRDILVLNTSVDLQALKNEALSLSLSCGGEIVPSLYALDVFLPLIDLGQENRCRIKIDSNLAAASLPEWPTFQVVSPVVSSEGAYEWGRKIVDWASSIADQPRFWLFAITQFKLLGWVISSLLILTFTKVFRHSSGE